jgi:hypothetical protein
LPQCALELAQCVAVSSRDDREHAVQVRPPPARGAHDEREVLGRDQDRNDGAGRSVERDPP